MQTGSSEPFTSFFGLPVIRHMTLGKAKFLVTQISIKLQNLTQPSLWFYNFVLKKNFFICTKSSKLR